MHLQNISNMELVTNFENLVVSERKITAHVIKHIAEIDRRRLFLEKGFTSVFDYLVKDIGYSPSAAMRRIDAARLMQELPEVVEKLETGSLTLSQAKRPQRKSSHRHWIYLFQLTKKKPSTATTQ